MTAVRIVDRFQDLADVTLLTGGGLLWWDGVNSLAKASAAGTSGQAAISGGAGTPTWFAPTAGSVLFGGTGGILQQDNSNLFWDDGNNRLGIGASAAPSVSLHIKDAASVTAVIENTSTAGRLNLVIPNVLNNQTELGFGSSPTGSGSSTQYAIVRAVVTQVSPLIGDLRFFTNAGGDIAESWRMTGAGHLLAPKAGNIGATGANRPTDVFLAGAVKEGAWQASIIGSAYGGTANGFTKFSGPASSEKTFILPNASAAILTDNAVVSAAQGGTGLSAYAVGDLIYASATTPTLARLAAVASDNVLISTGVNVAPAWTTTPSVGGLTVRSNSSAALTVDTYVNSTQQTDVRFRKARGTIASPATVVDGDKLGQFLFGAQGTSMRNTVLIGALVNGTVSGNTIPTDFVISVTNGATGPDYTTGKMLRMNNTNIYLNAPLLTETSNELDIGAPSNEPRTIYAGTGHVVTGVNGQSLSIKRKTELVAVGSGLTTKATTITIPADAIVLAVPTRIVVKPGGTTTMTVTATTSATAFQKGTNITTSVTATDPGTKNCPVSTNGTAAQTVTFTFNTSTTDALGSIRVDIYYIESIPPTS